MSDDLIQDLSDLKFEDMLQNVVSSGNRVILKLIDGICAFLDYICDELLGH
jgi:hypothetical protein